MTDRTTGRLVRLPQVLERVPLSTSTIYRRMKAGTFPQCVPIGDNSVAWYESDIDAWMADPAAWRAPAVAA